MLPQIAKNAVNELNEIDDRAAELADSISANMPITKHYFSRVVQHREERTSDVIGLETDSLTQLQLEIKRRR